MFRVVVRPDPETGKPIQIQEDLTPEEEAEVLLSRAIGAKQNCLSRLEDEFRNRYFSPFQTTDKVGNPTAIGFAKEDDMAKVNSAADYATRKNRKVPGFDMTYRDATGQVRTFAAADFEDIAIAMFEEKQAIERAYGNKLAEIQAMAATPENKTWFETYDVTTGWPT